MVSTSLKSHQQQWFQPDSNYKSADQKLFVRAKTALHAVNIKKKRTSMMTLADARDTV